MSYRLVVYLPDSVKPKLDACTASPAAVVRAIVLTHFGIDLVTMNPPEGKEKAQPVHKPAPKVAFVPTNTAQALADPDMRAAMRAWETNEQEPDFGDED